MLSSFIKALDGQEKKNREKQRNNVLPAEEKKDDGIFATNF